MNTQMWTNPFTQQHLNVIQSKPFNMKVILPREANLMCNTVGVGAMALVDTIYEATLRELHVL